VTHQTDHKHQCNIQILHPKKTIHKMWLLHPSQYNTGHIFWNTKCTKWKTERSEPNIRWCGAEQSAGVADNDTSGSRAGMEQWAG